MEALNLLLNATDKKSVEQAVILIFATRHQPVNISDSPNHPKPLQVFFKHHITLHLDSQNHAIFYSRNLEIF